MSVSEFARLIGVKPSQVSEWKRGKAKPSYDTMKQILNKTNKSADFFIKYDMKYSISYPAHKAVSH